MYMQLHQCVNEMCVLWGGEIEVRGEREGEGERERERLTKGKCG